MAVDLDAALGSGAAQSARKKQRPVSFRLARKRLSSRAATVISLLIAVLWSIPTFGLLVTSFRPVSAIQSSGWWTFFSHPGLSFSNYDQVLFGSQSNLISYFVNTVVITIPAVVIPVVLASLAAYAFAWIEFPFRNALYVLVFVVQIVPVQVALIPLLQMFVDVHINGTFWTLWLGDSIFALPLAIVLLHNFMSGLPKELIEAAKIDGASHARIFGRVMMPLIAPGMAALAIFQFLWVWNDLLVALTFAGGTPQVAPITIGLYNLVGTNGQDWQLLASGAFISAIIPIIVFFALQRYFVSGLLRGTVK